VPGFLESALQMSSFDHPEKYAVASKPTKTKFTAAEQFGIVRRQKK
jgi:hypothetical protein